MRMRNAGTTWTAAALTLAAAVLWPDAARAQETRKVLITDLPVAEQVRITMEKEAREAEASELLARARAAEKKGRWGKAARLYERSGGLRTDGDLLGATSFELAGRAFFFADRPGRASRMWEEAGHRVLIVGDVVGAARNFLHAAVAAQEEGKRARAAELGWKAYRITESGYIAADERKLIRSHLRVTAADDES